MFGVGKVSSILATMHGPRVTDRSGPVSPSTPARMTIPELLRWRARNGRLAVFRSNNCKAHSDFAAETRVASASVRPPPTYRQHLLHSDPRHAALSLACLVVSSARSCSRNFSISSSFRMRLKLVFKSMCNISRRCCLVRFFTKSARICRSSGLITTRNLRRDGGETSNYLLWSKCRGQILCSRNRTHLVLLTMGAAPKDCHDMFFLGLSG